MFDTHCHLDSFFSDSSSFQQTDYSTKYKFLAVATDTNNWQPLLAFSRSHSNVYAALGVHPWFITETSLNDVNQLVTLLESDVVTDIKAIGEIGLDFQQAYVSSSSLQLSVFEQQLTLAKKFNKPVSLHLNKAHNEAIALLKQIKVRGVLHGMAASTELLKQYLDLGFKIGVNGVSLRNNARRYHQTIQYCGLENIVLETDYPNIILPQQAAAHLSDINEVCEFIASLLNKTRLQVIEQTDENAKAIFG